MLRLIMVNLACRLMMKPFNLGGRNSLKPLSISRSLLLRVFHESQFREPSSFGTRLHLPVLRALPPDTIESDDELHR